ncbi:metallophosphoesterase [Parabacteroides bouchesdurhonensis]|uniref:metallophosphoesterase n=1 Tax=Parabacteroides bouchesdurhonensis TaxID=1936995 RepID=UPI000C82C518|nr:metallophosphoesterase [Parabacteroides bouchesdurhonensis]
MKKLLSFVIIASGLFAGLVTAQTKIPLKFEENGKFKIVQFTDLHWNPHSQNCAHTTATIKHVLQTEKPNLAIITGDVVTSRPAEKGWQAIIKIFEEEEIPFAVTMGNHDAEQGYTRETIYNWLNQSPYFVGNKGPEDIHGCGNFVIEVQGSKSDLAALLYCLDSHDYPENTRKYGEYDRIKYNQIEWYRKQSEQYTKSNGNKPLPSLAFFHIPIPEYHNIIGQNTTIGHNEEVISSPNINSALFSSMVDMGDIMGVFTGHDHDNDYIGINYGIALGFGRTTGADARGKLERGGRIIELYEGQQKFDTWIRTAKGKELSYYYPSGISSLDEENLKYLAAKNIKQPQQGVRYIYYEGEYKSTTDLDSKTEVKRGSFPNFTIKEAAVKDHFGYEFHTWIKIPERGVYRFYTYSDDGSKLLIDGNVIVDNDGSHSARYISGKVALEAGFHELKVLYFESYMGEELEVGIASRNMNETIIPEEMLFLPE